MTKIVACSVDYDNCGDNIFQKEQSHGIFVSQYNPHTDNALYKTLLTLYSDGSHRYLYVGSARQSWVTDFCDSCFNGNGSCFSNYDTLTQSLEVIFKKILLADICNDKDPGFTMASQKTDLTAIGDAGKSRLLYLQMHDIAHFAKEDDEIEFNFFDDHETILDGLTRFDPTRIPSNVTLKLYRYDGKEYETPKLMSTISGTGEKDKTYRETTLQALKTGTEFTGKKETSVVMVP